MVCGCVLKWVWKLCRFVRMVCLYICVRWFCICKGLNLYKVCIVWCWKVISLLVGVGKCVMLCGGLFCVWCFEWFCWWFVELVSCRSIWWMINFFCCLIIGMILCWFGCCFVWFCNCIDCVDCWLSYCLVVNDVVCCCVICFSVWWCFVLVDCLCGIGFWLLGWSCFGLCSLVGCWCLFVLCMVDWNWIWCVVWLYVIGWFVLCLLCVWVFYMLCCFFVWLCSRCFCCLLGFWFIDVCVCWLVCLRIMCCLMMYCIGLLLVVGLLVYMWILCV